MVPPGPSFHARGPGAAYVLGAAGRRTNGVCRLIEVGIVMDREIGIILVLIAAIGMARFVKADMVREGAVVIDVGINRVEDKTAKQGYRLVGDVDFDAVAPKASLITPVPGGVGPMTIAMLMHNTVRAAKMRQGIA